SVCARRAAASCTRSAAATRKPASTASSVSTWAWAVPAPGHRPGACTRCWRASRWMTWCWRPTPRTFRRPATRADATARSTCRPSAPTWRDAWAWSPRRWPRPPIATAPACSVGKRRAGETRRHQAPGIAGRTRPAVSRWRRAGAASDLEGADQLPQPRHRTGQLATGLLGLLRALGGALAGLADLHDVLIDVVGHGGLLLDGGRDQLVLINDAAHRGEDILQRLAHRRGVLHRGLRLAMADAHVLHGRVHPLAQADDHLLDFRGGLLGALRQAAHLVGDHGEAAPLLAGPRRLDGGVERQQVGLLGHPLDHIEDLADGLAVGGRPGAGR